MYVGVSVWLGQSGIRVAGWSTCWAHKMWNKIASDIKLVFYSSTIKPVVVRIVLFPMPATYSTRLILLDVIIQLALILKLVFFNFLCPFISCRVRQPSCKTPLSVVFPLRIRHEMLHPPEAACKFVVLMLLYGFMLEVKWKDAERYWTEWQQARMPFTSEFPTTVILFCWRCFIIHSVPHFCVNSITGEYNLIQFSFSLNLLYTFFSEGNKVGFWDHHAHVCVYACISLCVRANTHAHLCMCLCGHAYMHLCVCLFIYTHQCARAYMCICVCACVVWLHIYVCV